jgi:TatD DNase family protein
VIDTHAHLDAYEDSSEVFARARAAGVTRIVAVGSGIESCRAALALCERHDGVFAALGIHPHQAGEAKDDDLEELRKLLADPKAVAVGETGLDYYRDYAPRDRQAALFGAQLELASELGKPVVVHSRAAEEDTAAALREHAGGAPPILHCFSSVRLLEPALEHGWFVSFAGNVTFPKASDLRRAAARVPGSRLLAETDSPYLAPEPVRGKRNEPAYVMHTLSVLAEARGEDPAALERRIDANAAAALGLPAQ